MTPGPNPWGPKPCGNSGPFTKVRWTGPGRKTHVALDCNRPKGHDGNHMFSAEAGPTHEWDRRGQPVRGGT